MKKPGIVDATVYGTVAGSYGPEAIESMVIPEAIMPSQFADIFGEGRACTPEHVIRIAVVRDAIQTLAKSGPKTKAYWRSERQDDIDWFNSDDTEWEYSFVNICSVFGWEPDYIRRGLRACNWVPSTPMVNQLDYGNKKVVEKKKWGGYSTKKRREYYEKEKLRDKI